MKGTIGLLALLALSAGLAGCLNQSGFERSATSRVQLGMAKEDAVSTLGELELSCTTMGSTDNNNFWMNCSRERALIWEGCIQSVRIKISEEGKVSEIEIPKPTCAGL